MSNLHLMFAAELAAVDDRTVRGLIAPFGVTSAPHTWNGRGLPHQFSRGAFTRSIAERAHKIRLYVEHRLDELPIGRAVTLTERDDGLHAEFRIAPTARGDEALAAITDGLVTGFSIGCTPIRFSEHGGVIEHTETALREVSLVAEPAFASAATYSGSTGPGLPIDSARLRLRLLERITLR